MTPAIEALLTEVRRNMRVCEELLSATDLRIAYKTETGWKRLRAPDLTETLLYDAGTVVMDRIEVLLSTVATLVVDKAFADLFDEFKDGVDKCVKDAMFALLYGKC